MPVPVLETLQRDLLDYQGRGLSVLEMSHRGVDFTEIADKAESDLRALLAIPENYKVLFMQGGASSQFALTVQNLDVAGKVAFANTGYWSRKASAVAALTSNVSEVTQVSLQPQITVPPVDQWLGAQGASYLHITDNETIDGVQLDELPEDNAEVPLVVDMSSSILSRPIDVSRYGVIYAGAQKNIGPAGITVVIIRDDLLERSEQCNTMAPVFNYAAMQKAGSMLNTPPTFAWYAAGVVFQWLIDEGGLGAIAERNRQQAERVYSAIDRHDIYTNTVHLKNRSIMNVPFQLADDNLQSGFLEGCKKRHLIGLKGHKSIGGLRASLYNGVTDEAVNALVEYLDDFALNPTS